MINILFDYDRSGLAVLLPKNKLVAVLTKKCLPKNNLNPFNLIQNALANPIATPCLHELASKAKDVCIAIPDITRPLPLRFILPPILNELKRAGVPERNITLLVATGLHRACTENELTEMVGDKILHQYPIIHHNAYDNKIHNFVDTTQDGTRVFLDSRFLEADLRIIVGLVEPHFMAGYSGGRKVICPGICGAETIYRFHRYEILESPFVANTILKNNPVHRMATEIAKLAQVHFTINVVIDAHRQLYDVTAGDLELSFEKACQSAEEICVSPIPAEADLVLVSGGGYPLDTTWYQTIKAIVTAGSAVRTGGVIIVISSVKEGIGSESLSNIYSETPSLEVFLERIKSGAYFREAQWQLQMFSKVAQKAKIILLSEHVTPQLALSWFVNYASSPSEAIDIAKAEIPSLSSIIAMPHGPYVVPRLDNPN